MADNSDLFKAGASMPAGQARRRASVGSVVSEQGDVGGYKGLYRKDPAAKELAGRRIPGVDPRKFNYDRLRGLTGSFGVGVGRSDRLDVEAAALKLDELHSIFGVSREEETILSAWDDSLWLCHALNGSSALEPGRAWFGVPGQTEKADYAVVRDKLGTDFRRFFRAYADDVAGALKRVLASYDPNDPVAVELHGQVVAIAVSRGLQRFPYLIHDTAEACNSLSLAERAAINQSKTLVLTQSSNSADRMATLGRAVGFDNFDSTTGARNDAARNEGL